MNLEWTHHPKEAGRHVIMQPRMHAEKAHGRKRNERQQECIPRSNITIGGMDDMVRSNGGGHIQHSPKTNPALFSTACISVPIFCEHLPS